jgi:oligopeptide transport system substrate-binding protein
MEIADDMGTRPHKSSKPHWAGLTAALLMLSGCNVGQDDGPIQVDVIGLAEQAANPLRDSNPPAAKAVLGATAQGLLSYDARGEVVDALAESWIVADEGQSYIFRLKRLTWPNGETVKAEEVARLLRERMRANPLSMAGLKPDVRAMTDRVIEIRLRAALPAFLQLLAQPQFGILIRAGGTGPFRQARYGDVLMLTPVPRSTVPVEEQEVVTGEQRALRASRASLALVRFKQGDADLVIGGRFPHLPLIGAVGIDANAVRVDPVAGLLGLGITGTSDFLDDVSVRDALARVIDRAALAETWNVQGWRTAEYPLPAPLGINRQPSAPAWTGRPITERIESARDVIARWRAANGEPPMLRIALPEGPGASLLFIRLAQDFGQLGLRVDRVAQRERADLVLIDEVAPFDSALWYLSRLDCAAGLRCDPEASALLAEARQAGDPAIQAERLTEAEGRVVAHVGYIPLGQPIRWALADRRLTGLQLSPRGIHPLNRLIAIPN